MVRSILTLQLRAVGERPDAAGVENMLTGLPGVLDAAIDRGAGTVRLEVDGRTFRFRRLPIRPGLRASDETPRPPATPHRDGPPAAHPIPGVPGEWPPAGLA